jgi:MerR family copper efflux transcriptional regulator
MNGADMSMTIGEAAARSGVPAKTIRYYEQIGLIGAAARGASLYRSYGDDDVAMLRFIGRARHLGFPVTDLRNLLALFRDRTRPSREVRVLAAQHLAATDRKLAELASLRAALADLVARCDGDDRPDCPIIDELAGAPAGAA